MSMGTRLGHLTLSQPNLINNVRLLSRQLVIHDILSTNLITYFTQGHTDLFNL